MFKYKDTEYELRFSMKRVELIEADMDKSIMSACLAADKTGMMTMKELKAFFAYGLKVAGSDLFVKPGEARSICEGLVEEAGYLPAVRMVQAQLVKDLPFFFRTA